MGTPPPLLWGRCRCPDSLYIMWKPGEALCKKQMAKTAQNAAISMIKRHHGKRETACVGPQSITSEYVWLGGHCAVSMEKMEFVKVGFKPGKCWWEQGDGNCRHSRSCHLSTTVMATGDASPWQRGCSGTAAWEGTGPIPGDSRPSRTHSTSSRQAPPSRVPKWEIWDKWKWKHSWKSVHNKARFQASAPQTCPSDGGTGLQCKNPRIRTPETGPGD